MLKDFVVELKKFDVKARTKEEARQKANMLLFRRLEPHIKDIKPKE